MNSSLQNDPLRKQSGFERKKMSNYVWFAFVNDQNPMKKSNNMLVIPYDCEFIIIQPTNDSNFKITEIFTIENMIFYLEYGDWDFQNGLKVNDKFVYLRRSNLNGTHIFMILPEVSIKI